MNFLNLFKHGGPFKEISLRSIIETAHDSFIAMNEKGLITDWNKQAEITFGRSKAEAVGLSLSDTIIPERYKAAHEKGLKHFLATGVGPVLSRRIELPARHKDGREFPVEITISAVRQGDRHVFGAFLKDISELKRAELFQAVQLDVTRILVESITIPESISRSIEAVCKGFGWVWGGFWQLDNGKKRLLLINHFTSESEKLAEFIQLSQNLTLTSSDGLPGQVWKSSQPIWLADVASDPAFPRSGVAGRVGLHRAVALPVFVGKRFYGTMEFYGRERLQTDNKQLDIMNDIAVRLGSFMERKQAEDSLIQSAIKTAELQTSLKIRDEFLSIASHELRTPLTSLYLLLQRIDRLIKNSSITPDSLGKIHEMVKSSEGQAKQLGALIDVLLDVSKLGAGGITIEKKPTDLTTVLQHTINLLIEPAKRAGNSLVLAAADSVILDIDPVRIAQVFSNLISNAIKYAAGQPIEIVLKKAADKVRVSVTDHGMGIAPEHQERIFSRFERAVSHMNISGMGLGLYITQQIAEAHGGKIHLQSEIGKGSTFTLELPMTVITGGGGQ